MRFLHRLLKSNLYLWCIYTAMVIFASTLPGGGSSGWSWMHKYHMDKWIHLFMYLGWTVLGCSVYRRKKQASYVFLAALVLGALLEWVQGCCITGRSADSLDMVFNALGALLGVCIYHLVFKGRAFAQKPKQP